MIYDLTHPINPNIPLWNEQDTVSIETVLDYKECTSETKFHVQALTMPCGSGTHIDAPAHCIPEGKTIDQIPLEDLIRPVTIIESIASHANHIVSLSDIKNHETKHGNIQIGSVVLINTGWSMHWSNPQKYRNNYQYPSLSLDAAEYLVTKQIKGLGIDTLSPDAGGKEFPVHTTLLSADIYILENLCLFDIPQIYSGYITIMPMPIQQGTESPCRVFLEL